MTKIQKKKLLVIPHTSMTNVKVRALELAKLLTENYEVSYLIWGERQQDNLGSKIRYVFSELSGDVETWKEHRIRFIRMPVVHRPFWLIRRYNGLRLKQLLLHYSFDLVYSSASYLFPFPENIGVSYVYDLADEHAAGCEERNPRQARFVEAFIEAEIKKAHYVTVVSSALQHLVSEKYGKDSILIPNGANIKEYASVNASKVRDLRENLGISNHFVIGAIGNHGCWSGLEFLIRVFKLFRKEVPKSCLLIVGPGSEVDKLAPKLKSNSAIIFTGPKNPEQMSLLFSSINIGVLPFEVNSFTHSALPMKVIEYSAAKKIIVSTPLKGVESLDLPSIIFAEQELDHWVKALKEAMHISWKAEWDNEVAKYDWACLAAKLENQVFAKLKEGIC